MKILSTTIFVSSFLFLSLASGVVNAQSADSRRHIKVISDLEGQTDHLYASLDENMVLREGSLGFTNEKTELLFLGDIANRGPHTIELVNLLSDLKKRHPERVHLVGGNRDFNVLQVVNEVPFVASLEVPEYLAWLKESYPESLVNSESEEDFVKLNNTLTNQLQFVLNEKGLDRVLRYHREEMGKNLDREVSVDEAAANFYKWIQPGGGYWTYLEQLQLGFARDEIFAVHGGMTKHGVGFVPDRTDINPNADTWIADLNRWKSQDLAKLRKAVEDRKDGKLIHSDIISYGDAVYDLVSQRVISKSRTVIYSHKTKTDGNFGLYAPEVVDYLKKSGKFLALQGHSPVGNVALPLSDGDGFHLVMADNSRYKSSASKLEIKGDKVIGAGFANDGWSINMEVQIGAASPIGMKVGNKVIIGKTDSGKYIAYRYEGWEIVEVPIELSENEKLEVPWPEIDDSARERKKELEVVLKERGISIITEEDAKQGFYKNKVPLLLTGSVKFGYEPEMDEVARKFAEKLVSELNPERVYLVTGATVKGLEKHFLAPSQKHGIHNLGTVAFQSRAENIAMVDAILLAGETRVERMEDALKHLETQNGIAVFMAGGEIIKTGIKKAVAANTEHYLMTALAGAAKNMATGTTGFATAEALIEKLRRSRPDLFKQKEVAQSSSGATSSQGLCSSILGEL